MNAEGRANGTVYVHEAVATVGDTDCFQNMNFLNHLRISAATRELWIREHLPDWRRFLNGELILITASVTCHYSRQFRLFDPIRCELSVRKLGRATAELIFRFRHAQTLAVHASAWHRVTFMDPKGHIRPMPQDFHTLALAFLEKEPARETAATVPETVAAS